MKNIRVFYRKTGRLKYISHLDMNRVFTRLVRRSGLPIWYTEGFNPRPRINFALPLSLGFESTYEAVDIRLEEDDYPNGEALRRLQAAAPEELTVTAVADPIMKTGDIAFAEFAVTAELPTDAERFFAQSEILTEKKTKQGVLKTVDIRPGIRCYEFSGDTMRLVLSAGTDNVNPVVVLDAMSRFAERPIRVQSVTRTMLYNKDMEKFV